MGKSAHIVLAAVLLVLLPLAAHAVDPPHDPTNGYTCSTCHTVHISLGSTGYTNICLNCHRPGVPKGGNRPFSLADAANPFGTFTSVRRGAVYQTSHNWNGPDTNLAAGALPPQDPALTGTKTVGTIACSRCHDPHNNINKPFLRIPNDRDQLCLDCHRVRNTADHTRGTHPVNVDYAAAVARKPAGFNPSPVNGNPANPTSAMRLKNGAILCTTCHGIHYTDSNSATFDNHSAYNTLKPSDGYLLRTDLRGASADATNICTNCHVKKGHNGRGQNVQCADCHGAHVDVADGSVPNVFVIRRYVNVSSAAGVLRHKAVFMQYTAAGRRSYKDANGTGICQACHAVPTGGGYPAEHNLVTATAADCNLCHSHANPTNSFAASGASCSSCHGYPPRANTAGGPDGYAGTYGTTTGVNEANTPHKRHAGGGTDYAYACAECHKGNSHASGTFQDVFLDKAGVLAATGGAAPAYAGGTRSCSAVYCHSDGAPRNASLTPVLTTKAIPAWANGAGKITGCTSCHDAQPATNVHGAHLTKGLGCVTCHGATVSDNLTISDRSKHVNGAKDVSFGGALAAGTTWNAVTAGCSTSKCHSSGTAGNTGAPVASPVWTNPATGRCGTCHYTSPTIAATSAQTIATNGHGAHFGAAYGPGAVLGTTLAACQSCHDYNSAQPDAKHVNGTVETLAGAGSACAKCHPGTIPSWTATTRLACTSCHAATPSTLPNGVAAPYKANFATTGHGQAAATYAASRQCESCHSANSRHITGVLGDDKRLTLANDNTLCASCHNDATKVPTITKQNITSHVTVKGGTATSDCKLCHDVHGTTNLSMVRTSIAGKTIVFTNLSSGFVKTVAPFDGLCQVCHTQTNHYKSGQALDGHPTKGCLNCHSHQGSFAFQPVGGGACDSCHGYPPLPAGYVSGGGNYANGKSEDYPGGGGAHVIAKHIAKTAVPSEGWANCAVCHGNGLSNPATHTMSLPVTPSKVTVDVSDRFKFNHSLPLGPQQYSGKLLDGGANATGSCFNVKCHFKGSKKWSTTR